MPAINGLDIKVVTRKFWRGDKYLQNLTRELRLGVTEAAQLYRVELQKITAKTVGSVPVSGVFRVRKKHSQPGEPPYAQTFNLSNSFRYSSNFNAITSGGILGFGRKLEIQARVSTSTDVPYALILERGGFGNFGNFKPHTHWRLANPLTTTPYVHPRPYWGPTFERFSPTMKMIIQNRAGKAKVT